MTSMLNTAAAPDNSAPSSAPPTEAALRIAVGDVATRDFLRSELRQLLDDIEERQGEIESDQPGSR